MANVALRSGQLRHSVTIQKFARTDDGHGGFDEVFTEPAANVRDVFASVEPVKAREVFGAVKISHVITHRVIIRTLDIEEDLPIDRIKFGTRFFKIHGVRDLDERGIVTVLDAEEIKGSVVA